MPNQTTKAEILARIRKLARMTTENGCSEAEASFANEKVQALLTEHNLTLDEAQLREDSYSMIEDEFFEINSEADYWYKVCWPIGRLFHCRAWRHIGHRDELGLGFDQPILGVRYFGFETDVAASIAMTQICYSAIKTETARFSFHSRGKRKAADFMLGMATRLADRIDELCSKPVQATGRGLIPLKNQLVTENFAEHCRKNRYRFRNVGTAAPRNEAAFAAGQRAGSNVDLNARAKVSAGRAIEYKGR